MSRWPTLTLRHLARLTDDIGVVEHARLEQPRPELGYCTDDAGRALALASRVPTDPDAPRIARSSLGFLERAWVGEASFRLRCDARGRWLDDPPSDDATGRALLGLATAATRAPWPEIRARARALFEAAAAFESHHPRARAYAALGAVEVLATDPGHAQATRMAAAAIEVLAHRGDDPRWPWPEPRLSYANALLPDAALAAAVALGRDDDAAHALDLLDWLVAAESHGGRFSFTPTTGRGPDDPRPAFDQQPVEAWAMAEACARAFAVTRDLRWAQAVERAGRWFLGDNDAGVCLYDPSTGGGFDGLEPHGVNRNQGAESTMAFIATMRQVHELQRQAQPVSARAAAARASSSAATEATAAPTHRSAAP